MDNEIIVNGRTYVKCSIRDFLKSDNTIVVEVDAEETCYMEKPKPKPFEFDLEYMEREIDKVAVVKECVKGMSIEIEGKFYWVKDLQEMIDKFNNHPR